MAYFFITSGAVTAVFPTVANSATTQTNNTYTSSLFKSGDSIRLLGVAVLTRNTGAATDACLIVDPTGTTYIPITIGQSVASTEPCFPPGGIAVPAGGFGVTTAQAGSVYMWLFDRQPTN